MMENRPVMMSAFEMGLLEVLREIRDELKKDSYVNLKPFTISLTSSIDNLDIESLTKTLIEAIPNIKRKNFDCM